LITGCAFIGVDRLSSRIRLCDPVAPSESRSVKLRRIPEDFRVEEVADFPVGKEGAFAVYRLTKQGLGTLEAIDALMRQWKLERRQLSWGGLKDRHAVTAQHLTIHGGPRRNLNENSLRAEYLGQGLRPFTPADIAANRFSIVLRSLGEDDLQDAESALADVARDGLPNYFDDQRFGSVSAGGEFIARPWIDGNYERALWLTFAEPHPFDRSEEKTQKQILRDHWGDWAACKAALGRSHRRSVVTFLDDRKGDFRGAWARVKVDLRSLYLAAYQSFLWNQIVADLIRENCPADSLFDMELKNGPVPFFRSLSDESRERIHAASLPLPSARLKLEPGPITDLVERTLKKHDLELRQIRVKYPRDSFFSKGWRNAAIRAEGLAWTSGDDELAQGRKRLNLQFTLPRGAYATILVKRITAGKASEEATRENESPDEIETDSPHQH
jgi:tRNA pseudouridine13 synthase